MSPEAATVPDVRTARTRRGTSRKHPAITAFVRAPGGIAGGLGAAVLVALAIVAPMLWHDKATMIDLSTAYRGASHHHWLGTDSLGRDVLSRALIATRLSLTLGIEAAALSSAGGLIFGLVVASLGRRSRAVGRRAIEIGMSFPSLLLALFFVAVIGPGRLGAVIAIGLGGIPAFARLSESLASAAATREYMATAVVTGVRWRHRLLRYLLPAIAEPLVLAALVGVANSIINISALDFLGLGVQPPGYDWGTLLTFGVKAFYVTPLAALAPAVMIASAGLVLTLLGEAWARALNPRLWTAAAGRRRQITPQQSSEADATHDSSSPPMSIVADPVLEMRGLRVRSDGEDGIRLVEGVSFSLRQGEAVGIVGESGSGKTLTSLAVAQLLPYPLTADFEELVVDGVDLRPMMGHPRALRRALGARISMVFQDPMTSMNPAMRIGSQLVDGARRHRALTRVAARREGQERLREVGVTGRRTLRNYPHQYSGGMQQRIMLAMGLMTSPKVLIADEPTTALDVTVQAQVLQLLRTIQQRDQTAIILISHDLAVVNQLCERVMVMYAGRVVEAGSCRDVIDRPLHPYTRGLLASATSLDADPTARLSVIRGGDAAPIGATGCCPFAPRCPEAVDRCRAEEPPLARIDGERVVACFVRQAELAAES